MWCDMMTYVVVRCDKVMVGSGVSRISARGVLQLRPDTKSGGGGGCCRFLARYDKRGGGGGGCCRFLARYEKWGGGRCYWSGPIQARI